MSGIRIIADTNPIIYLLSGSQEVAEYLDGKQVWISVISELELFGKQGLNQNQIKEINYLLDSCFIAEINPQIKQIAKDLMQNHAIKVPDAIVAASSLYLDLPLLTYDTGFKKIEMLKLVLFET
ncbi:MAG: type II toxin-antitoxin system VapC family toxin [Bacteroidales bacterium]|nr:type II toxin-antitoxin system VapC family toxin [Bacteroidales bacterium]